jgi:hypothetical protein
MKKTLFSMLLVMVVTAAQVYGMAGKVESVADKMQVSLGVQKKGHEAVLTIAVRNSSKNKIELVFPSSNTKDFLIKDRDGKVVWQWTKDRLFREAQTRLSIDPGKSVSHSATWDLTDLDGKDIAPGTYTVNGILPVLPTAISTETRPIEVLEEDLKIAGGYIITGRIAVRGDKVFIDSDDGTAYRLANEIDVFSKLGGKYIRVFAPVFESIPGSNEKKMTVNNYKVFDSRPVE